MSLLKHLKGIVGGAASGYSAGGFWGAVVGGVAGAVTGPGNPKKTKNVGAQPTYNVTKGKFQPDPNLSPVALYPPRAQPDYMPNLNVPAPILSAPVAAGTMSASGLVRNAALGGMTNVSMRRSMIYPAAFGGSGATGSYNMYTSPPIQAPQTYIPAQYDFTSSGQALVAGSPAATWLANYTKKGTPRKRTAAGRPYRRPRMNPMNVRAARRAIRRIRSARKLLQRIERSLPKTRTHTRPTRRRAA